MVNLLLMIYFYRKYCQFAFDLGMTSSEVKQYAVMLFPIVANELLWTLGQSVNTFIYGHMGTGELAGMSLTGPIQGLFIGALQGCRKQRAFSSVGASANATTKVPTTIPNACAFMVL